jgi:hypothetical protein
MTTLTQILTAALTSDRERMVEQSTNIVRSTLERVQAYAERAGGRIQTGWYSEYHQWQFVRPKCRAVKHDDRPFFTPGHDRPLDYVLDDERVRKFAESNADAIIAQCVAKLVEKLGALDSVEILDFHGFQRFTVRGVRNGHTVAVEQSMIINVSPKGKLFNQFPALIYVDGVKVSAAKLEAALA